MAKILDINSREMTIKRLLRRQNTHEYFKEDGWTSNPAEAKCFSDVIEVAETCARCGLDDVELTLRVDAQASDFFCTPVR
ncbi:MAG TPA: hypothetical protein VL361_30085 [Candidatus Limnocylindrales bacterium]|jgi:hypothetical protein|nr:hypothetical protein [Candidatus Limnocylindrales bacterium]